MPTSSMRTITPFLTFCLVMGQPAAAQEGTRPTDIVPNQIRLTELIVGHIVEFYDGSKSRYRSDGVYGYTYTDKGAVWSGQYTVHDDGQVCVNFDNGSKRCDTFVEDGQRLVLITDDGLRFPVRNRSVYQR